MWQIVVVQISCFGVSLLLLFGISLLFLYMHVRMWFDRRVESERVSEYRVDEQPLKKERERKVYEKLGLGWT